MLIRFASLSLLVFSLGLVGCATNKPAISDAGLVDENGNVIAVPLPDGFEDNYRKGLSLLEDGETDEAVEHWEKMSQSDPEYSGVWTNYGLALFRQGKVEEALVSYENAQAVDPAYCPVNGLKGIALRDLGRFDEAQNSYEAGIECAPKDARNYYNLGILHDLYRNDLVAALGNYRKARRLMPDEDVLNIWVVDLARRSGEPEEDPAELDDWEQSLNEVSAPVADTSVQNAVDSSGVDFSGVDSAGDEVDTDAPNSVPENSVDVQAQGEEVQSEEGQGDAENTEINDSDVITRGEDEVGQ
jgi:tetratricopeptide (TPR) repeat protein